ncbi:CYFA0S01e15522g1_1 [Cyberlindnera fabianii]|uniref:CYFA0S01e15522g1_1 n=1 Tax=Cyberlindnera fabianii TaxID=36022 RepID=A0A061AJE4_CYBFA|nr:CYFA0S01e15522g1_1 [Cyberlindnera fabianii]
MICYCGDAIPGLLWGPKTRGRGKKTAPEPEQEPVQNTETETTTKSNSADTTKETVNTSSSKPSPAQSKKETPKPQKATPAKAGSLANTESKVTKPPVLKKQTSTPALTPTSPVRSPTKLNTSRIPSPVRRSVATKPSVDSFDITKVQAALNQAFTSKNIPKLSSILDDLKSTKADQLFNDLKNTTNARAKASEDLIKSLTVKNEQLATQLETALARIEELEEKSAKVAVAGGLSEEAEYENQLILDMMEQVVGLRIHKAEDSDAALSFSCSQSGKHGILDYKLIIYKEDSSEIIYEPLNSKDEQEDLKKFLPDYFFDDLTFPLDTLQQFYHKISRGLNK